MQKGEGDLVLADTSGISDPDMPVRITFPSTLFFASSLLLPLFYFFLRH
jgi:hypothetical protein